MHVALDTNAIFTCQAGANRYVQHLLRALRALGDAALEIQEVAWRVNNLTYRQPQRSIKTAYRELVWAPFMAPRMLRRAQVELFHSTAGILVRPPRPIRHVVTLYDLAVLRYPNRFRRWQRWATAHRLKWLRQADRILCISRFTADEAIELLDLPVDKLEVVYIGGNSFDVPAAVSEAAPDVPVPSDFLLFVGSLEPGKNLSLIRQTYELAVRRQIHLPPLMIVGARWKGVANEGLPPSSWHYLGRQPDASLVYLMRRAIALLFPSKYEGFGLPVNEAMSLGCPVVCSPVASIKEVGGEAAFYADLTPEAYLKAIQRLLKDSSLRAEFIQKGFVQARQFSWKRCAEETMAVYRSVLRS